MKCQILHESKGRMRIHFCISRMSLSQADLAEYYLRGVCGVADVKVFDRTADAVVFYSCKRSRHFPLKRPKTRSLFRSTPPALSTANLRTDLFFRL